MSVLYYPFSGLVLRSGTDSCTLSTSKISKESTVSKVTLIKDTCGNASLGTRPLRVTERKARGKRGASFRVGCGCCTEGLVVFPLGDADEKNGHVEINGVIGTVNQWQQIFGPLLKLVPATK